MFTVSDIILPWRTFNMIATTVLDYSEKIYYDTDATG